MVEIKKVKITKVGGSRYFLIPSDYFEHGGLDETKTYNLAITEEEANGNNNGLTGVAP